MKEKMCENKKISIASDFFPRKWKRRSLAVCVKISRQEKEILNKLRGSIPVSTFLRESALSGEANA